MADEAILEGFICPHCMENKGSLVALQQHFEEFHSQKRNFAMLFRERDSSVKGLFSRTKLKFTSSANHSPSRGSINSSLDYSTEEGNKYRETLHISFNPSGINAHIWEEQKIGHTRSFIDQFRSRRDKHVDRLTAQTNQVLIRLEKLTSMKTSTICSPSDKKLRKMEMDVVLWQPDKDGKSCAICTKKLIMASKHHCRLCGMVICGRCSLFLPMPIGVLLEKTNKNFRDEAETRKAVRMAKEQANEQIESGKLDNALRLCTKCNEIVEKRMMRLDSMHSRSRLTLLYTNICDIKRQVDILFPKYETMISGLLDGKLEYTREEARRLRFTILQLTESIDVKSKKVLALVETSQSAPGSECAEVSPRQMRLHKGVRSYAVKYLQERITCLPNVPSDSEISRIRSQREEERGKLVRRATERPLDTRTSWPGTPGASRKPRSQSYLLNTGWVASSTDSAVLLEEDEDPYVTQLRQLRVFLSQAENEGREDEVLTLKQEVELLRAEIERRDL